MSGPIASGLVAEFLIATTVLMALVLLVRPLVRRVLGAGAAYAIWFVPAIIPLNLRGDPLPGANGIVAPMKIVFATATDVTAGAGWLIWPWSAGVLLFSAWQVVAYRRFLSRALADAVRLNASGTPVFATDAVDGPAAAGLFTWRIFVPRDIETRFTSAERNLARRHELQHLSAGHLWANTCAIGMLALHWFNPLAYLAFRSFREDQELSCDVAVIAAAGPEDRAAYGAAMVKSTGCAMRGARSVPLTTCPMTRADTLKRRLSMIKTHRKAKRAFAGEIAAVALVAAAGSMLTATSGIAAEALDDAKLTIIKGSYKGAKGAAEAAQRTVEERCGDKQYKIETEAVTDQGDRKKQTRVVMCGTTGATSAERVAKLQKTRSLLSASTEIDPAHRGMVLSAIDDAIAKAKAE